MNFSFTDFRSPSPQVLEVGKIKKKTSISTRLLKTVFGFYFIVAVVVTIIQLGLEYVHINESVSDEITNLQDTFSPGLSRTLWTFSFPELKSIMLGMYKVPSIVGIKIIDEKGKTIALGDIIDNTGNKVSVNIEGKITELTTMTDMLFGKEFNITFNDDGEIVILGVCTIYSSSRIIINRLKYGFFLIIINSVVKTSALWFIFIYFTNLIIKKPLLQLTDSIDKMDPKNPHYLSIERNEKAFALTKAEDEFGELIRSFNNMGTQLKMTLNTFEKFVPKQFQIRVAKKGIESIELGNVESAYVTILFSDIRAFTTLSESMKPENIFEFLNEYMSQMEPPIHKFGGFIDKFIGDAIMALFAMEARQQSAHSAVDAAIGMQKALQEWNKHQSNYNYPAIGTGIGIHSGDVMIGTIGSSTRMDSTAIGDAVNLASRIESMTKVYGTPILISESTFNDLADPLKYCIRVVDRVVVKGKTKPVTVFEVFDADPDPIKDMKLKIRKQFENIISHYDMREFEEIIKLMEESLKIFPEDKTAKFHIEQCQKYKTKTGSK
jgi:class 3 adenylate cyclase